MEGYFVAFQDLLEIALVHILINHRLGVRLFSLLCDLSEVDELGEKFKLVNEFGTLVLVIKGAHCH